MTRNIPNVITCLNLLCGCLSIVSLLDGRLEAAAYFILAATVFDFLDGFIARLLMASSAIGKELDLLADMVSFGVAPATIMYVLIDKSAHEYAMSLPIELRHFVPEWIALFAYIIAIFSALRLAKFNIDTRQSDSFIGMPTPANAMFICSLVFISSGDNQLAFLAGNFFFLSAVTIVFSYLLVSELPFFSLKFKSFYWKSNRIRYFFVLISVLILLILHYAGVALIILVYIILSIITGKSKIINLSKWTHER